MLIPTRILRAQADERFRQRRRLSTAFIEQESDILEAATLFFVEHGRCAIAFARLAAGLRLSARTLRRYFVDLDALLAEIMDRHLLAILAAMQAIPRDHQNPVLARRAAYHAATRGALNAPTLAHILLTQQRVNLPPDLKDGIEIKLASIGSMLDPKQPELALSLLDNPYLTLDQADAILSALSQPHAPAQTSAEPPTEPLAEPPPARPAKPASRKPAIPRGTPWQEPAPSRPLLPPPSGSQMPPARAGPA